MRLYSTLGENTNRKIANILNIDISADSIANSDVAVLYNYSGQDIDISINDPGKVLIVSEIKNKSDEQAVIKAVKNGVLEDNIFVIPPGGTVKANLLIERLGPLISQLRQEVDQQKDKQQEDIPQEESSSTADENLNKSGNVNSVVDKDKEKEQSTNGETQEKETEDTSEKERETGTPKDDEKASVTENDENKKEKAISKVIGLVSYKGGVGKTSLGTSLMAHYSDIGEKTCFLDMSYTKTSVHSLGENITCTQKGKLISLYETAYGELIMLNTNPARVKTDWLKGVIEKLKHNNNYVIIDLPVSPDDELLVGLLNSEVIVNIIDYDIFQTVEPASKKYISTGNCFVVYNKAVPEVPRSTVTAYFKKARVEEIKMDRENCIAALAENLPPSSKSEEFAEVIGRLANHIHQSGGETNID